MRRRVPALLLIIALSVTSGCATVRTMPALGTYGSPQVYSGARLDLRALNDDRTGLDEFKVKPPAHPGIDLPFSMVLDTILLPVVLPVVAYELIFN